MGTMKKALSSIPFLLSFLMIAGDARADVLATSVREMFPTSVTTTVSLLRLNDAGATSLAFSTPTTQTVVITYNGDCSVSSAGNPLAVIIYVDGVAAPGTGAGSAGSRMCADTLITAASRSVAITVGPGAHTVQVTGQIIGSGTGGFLRTVLTVMN
jgi:hypothetical protein